MALTGVVVWMAFVVETGEKFDVVEKLAWISATLDLYWTKNARLANFPLEEKAQNSVRDSNCTNHCFAVNLPVERLRITPTDSKSANDINLIARTELW